MSAPLRIALLVLCAGWLGGCVVPMGLALNAAGAKPAQFGTGSDASKP